MKRRSFIKGLIGLAAVPVVALPKEKKVARVGYVTVDPAGEDYSAVVALTKTNDYLTDNDAWYVIGSSEQINSIQWRSG